MRLLALPLVFLGSAFTAPRAPEPPRPLVILVHGRGMSGADSATMRRAWKQDLDSALASARFPALAGDDVRLAWYADVMDPSVSAACSRGYTTEAGLADVARGFLAGLVSVIPDSGSVQDREARSLFGDMLYLVDPATRCAAETRFENVLAAARAQGRPVIVVAYSLGAAVAYGFLQRETARVPALDVQLITLGSPLAVPVARELLLGVGALRRPPAVARWVNIYDPDDAFAAPLGMPDAVFDRRTRSARGSDPHGVSRYLRDEETGRTLADAMCGATNDAWTPRCADLRADGR